MNVLKEPFRKTPPYRFGEGTNLQNDIMDLGRNHFTEILELQFPPEAVFVDRTIVGHFGNLCKLRAQAPWRELLETKISSLAV